jgi:outer membrane protein assembly factor BamB
MSPSHAILLALWLLPLSDDAQPKDKAPEPPITVLPTDARADARLVVAKTYIDDKDWLRAITALQAILDAPDDLFVQVPRRDKDGKETVQRVNSHTEAERMLRSLPADARQLYRTMYNKPAADLLKMGKDKESADLLELVARRHVYTDSGVEALESLASLEFQNAYPDFNRALTNRPFFKGPTPPDGAHLVRAARAYAQLLELRGGPDRLNQMQLLQAAVAFHALGEHAQSARMWNVLQSRVAKEGPKATKRHPVAELRAAVERQETWPIFGGDPSRSAQGVGGMPTLVRSWRQSLFSHEDYSDSEKRQHGPATSWIASALKSLEARKQATIPAYSPITCWANFFGRGRTPLAIFRSHWGIHAVDVMSGRLMWTQELRWGLDTMFSDARTMWAIRQWKQRYEQRGLPNIVLENTLIGTLSSDDRRIYCVDDFAVPPDGIPLEGTPRLPQRWGEQLEKAVRSNVLTAFDIDSGRALYELGGHPEKPRTNDPDGRLHDSYFLGPPLPLGGVLYVLNEKDKQLRLAVLDPRGGTIKQLIPLATVRAELLLDPVRRLHAASLAYGDGILVCPTNAGAILGVDLQALNLSWAYVYRDDKAPPAQRQNIFDPPPPLAPSEWKNTAPVIADGKVVITAPDAKPIHCLNLKGGTLLWKAEQQPGDLYLAGVYGDKVLIVGNARCRALKLADGTEAWSADTGLPSGRGIAAANRYYLPLKSAAESKEPEIAVLDIGSGKIVEHVKSPKKEVPGNLLFFQDMLLSQTATQIAAYPLAKAKETQNESSSEGNK